MLRALSQGGLESIAIAVASSCYSISPWSCCSATWRATSR